MTHNWRFRPKFSETFWSLQSLGIYLYVTSTISMAGYDGDGWSMSVYDITERLDWMI